MIILQRALFFFFFFFFFLPLGAVLGFFISFLFLLCLFWTLGTSMIGDVICFAWCWWDSCFFSFHFHAMMMPCVVYTTFLSDVLYASRRCFRF